MILFVLNVLSIAHIQIIIQVKTRQLPKLRKTNLCHTGLDFKQMLARVRLVLPDKVNFCRYNLIRSVFLDTV